MSRDATEAEDWEAPVGIVGLDDQANVEESALVLVVGAQIMQRVAIAWVTVRGRVVDSADKRDGPS